MSLYNMMCGNNPLFGVYARILETVAPIAPVPRFRDMYTREVDGAVQVVIYTRTGGGNRGGYSAENAALADHPLFVCDFDDDFDSTFAHFVYRVPDLFAERLLRLHRVFSKFPNGMTPRQKFERSMGALEGSSSAIDPGDSDITEIQDALEAIVCDLPEQLSSVEMTA